MNFHQTRLFCAPNDNLPNGSIRNDSIEEKQKLEDWNEQIKIKRLKCILTKVREYDL